MFPLCDEIISDAGADTRLSDTGSVPGGGCRNQLVLRWRRTAVGIEPGKERVAAARRTSAGT